MNDPLSSLFTPARADGAPDGVLLRLLVAAAFGLAIAGIYRFTRRSA